MDVKTRVCFRDNLRVVLRQLDFEVEVYNDLPYKEIERILEQASMEDHSDADCVFVTGQKKAGTFSVSGKTDLSPGKKVGAARCVYVFDVHRSRASERLKVVLVPCSTFGALM